MGTKRASDMRHRAINQLSERRRAEKKRKGLSGSGHLMTHRHRAALVNREAALTKILEDISSLICGYPRVSGMYYKINCGRVEITVVAQRPMTRPIQELLDGFSKKLAETIPEIVWDFTAAQSPPPNPADYNSMTLTLQ